LNASTQNLHGLEKLAKKERVEVVLATTRPAK
jgi:hypothetical protein